MQCPRCAANNHLTADRCVACGADLVAAPASPRAQPAVTSIPAAPTPANVRILHRSLGTGLVLVAAAVLVLRYLGVSPMSSTDSATPPIAYTLSGCAVVLLAVALSVFKPRAPGRLPGQSVEEYWSTTGVSERVFLVWFVFEGAGMLAAVGYLLTGEPAAALAMSLAVVVYWSCGPNVFTRV